VDGEKMKNASRFENNVIVGAEAEGYDRTPCDTTEHTNL
jgi:hypothetical protein